MNIWSQNTETNFQQTSLYKRLSIVMKQIRIKTLNWKRKIGQNRETKLLGVWLKDDLKQKTKKTYHRT